MKTVCVTAMKGIILHVLSLLLVAEGSVIVFEATPTVVKEGLTESLHLRCSLNDTTSTASGAIVGRDLTTQTNTDVHQVSALMISKDGKEIAAVSQIVAAKALNASDTAKVTGDISNGIGERGYIDIVWEYPTHDHSGEYVCEATAISDLGHGVQFTKSVEIGIAQPTIPDLVNKVKDLSIQVKDLNTKETLSNQRIDMLNHTETGLVHCGNSQTDSWTLSTLNSRMYVDITQKFREPYEHTPVVKLGIVSLDLANPPNTRVVAILQHVDKTSVTVRCETWGDSHVYRMAVSWISVAN